MSAFKKHAPEFRSLSSLRFGITPDPVACHCGKPALYRYGLRGFCKEHRAGAVALATAGSAARVAKHEARYDEKGRARICTRAMAKGVQFNRRKRGE